MESIDILELNTEQMEQSSYKNDFIAKTQGAYAGFVNKNITDRQQVTEIIEEFGLLPEYGAVLFGEDIGNGGDINLTEILKHPRMKIYALLVERKLLAETGSFHEELPALNTYEFLCRIAGVTKVYGIPCAEEENTGQPYLKIADETGKTLAYIMRRYMTELKEKGELQKVLEGMFAYAGETGCGREFKNSLDEMMNSVRVYEKLARNTAPFFIIPVNNASCYSVPGRFAAMFAEELVRSGQALIELNNNRENAALPSVLKGVIGFQSMVLEGESIRRMGCPKYQFLFDNPIYFNSLLHDLPKEYVILCQDRYYAEYIKTYYGTENALQFPPAGEDAGLAGNTERPYDVVFIGTYQDVLSPKDFNNEQRCFYDYMVEHPDITFEEGYRRYLITEGRIADGDEAETGNIIRDGLEQMTDVCRSVTALYRTFVIDTLLEAGITVHVYGESWKNYHTEYQKYLIMHPEVSVEESLEILGHAKIGLNIMTWHKAGMTERIANIMFSGAVCLSDETAYLRENYADGEEMVLFRLSELSELPPKILPLLRDEELRQKMTAKAYKRACEEHTWKKRTEEFLELHRSMFQ